MVYCRKPQARQTQTRYVVPITVHCAILSTARSLWILLILWGLLNARVSLSDGLSGTRLRPGKVKWVQDGLFWLS